MGTTENAGSNIGDSPKNANKNSMKIETLTLAEILPVISRVISQVILFGVDLKKLA